jgi:hypothetical protein
MDVYQHKLKASSLLLVVLLGGGILSFVHQNVFAQSITSPIHLRHYTSLTISVSSHTVKPNAKFTVTGTLQYYTYSFAGGLDHHPIQNAKVNVHFNSATIVAGFPAQTLNTMTDSKGHYSATFTAPGRGGVGVVNAGYAGDKDNLWAIGVPPEIITIR